MNTCVLRLAGALLCYAAMLGTAAIAQTAQPQTFDLPAEPLPRALARFTRATGILVVANAALTHGKASNAVKGRFSNEAALDMLLSGTGLRKTPDGRAGFVLVIVGVTPASAQTRPKPDDAEPSAELSSPASADILVIGTPESRYVSQTPQTGSRITKDILDTPRTVDAIPEQVLRDQHIRELSEIYRYSANVVNNDGYGGTREDYIIRGFRRRDDVYRDGVRLKTNSIVDPSTVSSVEILKGPTSDIGQMTPGGLINIITKKPQVQDFRRAEVNVDSRGRRQGYVDVTGGIGGERFAYRLTGSYENGHTFRDFSDVRRSFVNGGLSWFGDGGLRANITYEHGDDNRPLDRGFVTLPIAPGAAQRFVPDLPRSTRLDPPFSRRRSNYNLATADLVVPIAAGWQAEGKLLYNDEDTDEVHTEVRAIAANGTLTRRVEGNDDRDLTTRFGRLQVRGEGTLGFQYKTVIGIEYRRQTESWINFVGANQVFGTAFNPRSDQLVNNGATPVTRTRRSVSQEDYGPYAQIDIQLVEPLTLTLGGRYESFRGDFTNDAIVGTGSSRFTYPTDQKFTKSGALTYKPAPSWTIYANYSDTFQPQNFYENATRLFPPQEGRMVEAGVKKGMFGNRLLLTAAVFDIKQSNLVEVANGVPFLSGGQTSRGMELAAIGSPLRGLNVRAGFGYADAEVTSRDAALDGQLPTNVPRYNANAYASYEVRDSGSALNGFGVGAGVVYVSERFGDIQHSFSIGNYAVVDSSAWYYVPLGTGRQLRLTAGVKNIGDERYYTASGGTFRISVGAPRTVFAGVGVEF